MTLLVGNNLDLLPTLEAGSVQTCVTSPPYFRLRDYGVEGQHGMEETPEAFVANLVAVFREVRRVLRDDGTLWLNLGDSYAGGGRGGTSSAITGRGRDASMVSDQQRLNAPEVIGDRLFGYKPKELMGMPWRVAFALQADGWYLRQDIIWSKPNPMPESVTDRCTKAHEYLFLLTKSPRYYYDAEAIKEEAVHAGRVVKASNPETAKNAQKGDFGATAAGFSRHDTLVTDRNKRSVWTVATMPFKEAHFATFPEALIEPCILAGSRPGDRVLDPYMGAGTTAVVCARLASRWVGCELSPEYADIIRRRLVHTQPGLALA